MNVVIAADIDVSRPFGDTGRTLAFATGLQASGCQVALVIPPPKEPEMMIATGDIRLEFIPVKQVQGSLYNTIQRMWSLIQHARKLCRQTNAILMVETSQLGGYFALLGVRGYVLDVHGITFDEVSYARLPWYIPRKTYTRFVNYLERKGLAAASKVIVVSSAMSDYLKNNFFVDPAKVIIIPNGYFSVPLEEVMKMGCQEEEGAVTFVGVLEKWAVVDKVIRAADALRKEKATFYIVGDGTDREELENYVRAKDLTNIVFLGKMPLYKAYEYIAKAQIVLSPLDLSLSKLVCQPIKVLEYMAFGKAMVLDRVSDLSKYLEVKNAALVCNPDDEQEFIDNIKSLLYDSKKRHDLGVRARDLVNGCSWDDQVDKLFKILI